VTGRDIRVGVDIGGTFTDLTMLDFGTGVARIGKTLSTPDDLLRGVVTGLKELQQLGEFTLDEVTFFVHGTTVVTNALIERKGCRAGLLCTEGARDVIEICREFRYDIYDLDLERARPLVPRELRVEVPERMSAAGRVLRELDPAGLERAVALVRDSGVESVAIAFLHSYANPEHERAAAALVERLWPGVSVTLSSDLVPEVREYERTSTTVANAYVRPVVADYLDRLRTELRAEGLAGELYVMLSSGGLATVTDAAAAPVRMVESGPAGGALAAQFFGRKAGEPNYVSFDMGGTTAKICAVRRGELPVVHEFESARVRRFKAGSGLPLRVPVIDMIEIGAGGGSLAWVDDLGLLKVGPESAGAAPGPACYGLGGTRPTITDADVVLGYLDPAYFLGGRMTLGAAAAREAVRTEVADRIGQPVPAAAAGIIEVVTESMASAVRLHMAEQGQDLADSALFAFGGAGPVHAHRLAQLLGMRRIVYPLRAGVLSSLGFLLAPRRLDLTRSTYMRLDAMDWAEAGRLVADMCDTAVRDLAAMSVPAADVRLSISADLRFPGQGHEIEVDLDRAAIDGGDAAAVIGAFQVRYAELFGRVPVAAGAPEILTWRVVASGPVPDIDLRDDRPVTDTGTAAAPVRRRDVYFAEAGGYLPTPVYDRLRLVPGTELSGPAILEEEESTVVVGPGAAIRIDGQRNVLVELAGGSHDG
jgi:N-methylhydantoinase A